MQKRLKRLATTVPTATDEALEVLAHEVLDTAAASAPHDTGELARSGYIERRGPGVMKIGFRAPHAAAVHERLDLSHSTGKAKFLEGAMIDKKPAAMDALADAARAAIEAEGAGSDA